MVAGFFREMLAQVDWNGTVAFGGVLLAAICFVALQMVRSAGLRKKLAALEDKLADRMDEHANAAVQAALVADGRSREALREAQRVQHRLEDVEARIPSLQEKLEHFRRTLASIFQNELGAVLSSFDSSVTAVLEHMKADLHMGVARIETIEDMVQSRQKAGRTLLCSGDAPLLADGLDVRTTEDTPESSETDPGAGADETPASVETDVLAVLEEIELDDAADERPEAA